MVTLASLTGYCMTAITKESKYGKDWNMRNTRDPALKNQANTRALIVFSERREQEAKLGLRVLTCTAPQGVCFHEPSRNGSGATDWL